MKRLRKQLSVILVGLLITQTAWAAAGQQSPPAAPPGQEQPATVALAYQAPPSLDEVVKLPSFEIAALAEKFTFDAAAVAARIEALKKLSKQQEEAYKTGAKAAEKQVEAKERELSKLPSRTDDAAVVRSRKKIQCEIVKIRKDVTDQTYDFLQKEIATDVELAKLHLLANWGSTNRALVQKISGGTASQRAYGNVLDIGNRSTQKPFKGQDDDIKWGQQEIDAARQRNVLPKEVDDPVLKEYVNRVAQNIARNSDLAVPLKVYLVQQEVRKEGKPILGKDGQPQQVTNAMALPGGSLFIFAGVMLASDNESQLAGVIAHEMAHSAARHGRRLANKGRTFGIVQLAAVIGLQIFAPGLFYAGSYLGYYLKGLLLQAIFNGMGLVFTIDALGVSRDFELEADQLGMQYAWKTGYDPRGFVDLFDAMSQKEGYASRTSFFATHPAYGDRTLNTLKEYKVLHSLTPERQYLTDTSEFQEMKERLRKSLIKTPKQIASDVEKPTLKGVEPEPADCEELLGSPSASPSPGAAAPATTAPGGCR